MSLIPHNEQLENSVLGGLLLNQNEYPDIQEHFYEELFYGSKNKFIARAIKSLKDENKSVDIGSVNEWLKHKGLKIPAYEISSLTNEGALFGFKEKVMALNQYHIRRNIILKNTKIIEQATEDTCDALELISDQEKALNELLGKIAVSRTPDSLDCYNELIDHLTVLDKLSEGELIGIDTGFRELNTVTAGWQKSDLLILAARPGMGKTSFALNCASAAVLQNKPTLFFSIEMSKLQLFARICSQITKIPLQYFLKYKMTADLRTKFNQLTYQISQAPLYIEDKGGMDLNYIKSRARKMKRDKGIELIVVDYLQLISRPKTNKSTNDEISEVSGALKGLAKELNVPVIALSQLTRAVESTPDKRPSLIHLRDGGSIEQDADIVMFIYRPEYYGITDDGNGGSTIGKAELIIAKNRNGALGSTILGFEGVFTNFYDLY